MQTAGRSGFPNSAQRLWRVNCAQRTPAGLPSGMPGMGEEMEIAIQQAPQPTRHSMSRAFLEPGPFEDMHFHSPAFPAPRPQIFCRMDISQFRAGVKPIPTGDYPQLQTVIANPRFARVNRTNAVRAIPYSVLETASLRSQ
jgi:hypothetical protein